MVHARAMIDLVVVTFNDRDPAAKVDARLPV
jgi:hypothetical protein